MENQTYLNDNLNYTLFPWLKQKGLKPIHFDDEQIKIMVDFITKLKSRVDLSLLEPKIFWKN